MSMADTATRKRIVEAAESLLRFIRFLLVNGLADSSLSLKPSQQQQGSTQHDTSFLKALERRTGDADEILHRLDAVDLLWGIRSQRDLLVIGYRAV
jgi:hypothetical protein